MHDEFETNLFGTVRVATKAVKLMISWYTATMRKSTKSKLEQACFGYLSRVKEMLSI